ncbi:MAG: hypothetical protein Crog4KO_35830 [Crocinitomicaceae bacterium]
MKQSEIEPGVLSLFRLVTILSLILVLINLVLVVLWDNEAKLSSIIWSILRPAIVLAFLYSDNLEKKLKQWYMPIALLLSLIGTFTALWFQLLHGVNRNIPIEIFVDTADNILLTSLFVPLLIIITQYGLKIVFIFTLLIAFLHYLLGLLLLPADSVYLQYIVEQSLTIAVLSPILGIFFGQLIARQKDERRSLSDKNLKLTQYATMVEQLTISQERNRMARELHDTLAHTLSAVSVQLEVVEKQINGSDIKAKESLKLSQTLIREGLQDTRRALRALRVSTLEDMGFSLALQQLVATNRERSGIHIELYVSEKLDMLSPQIEQSLYRVAEEALNNAIRHAQAQRIEVRITYENDTIELLVTDDGVGFKYDTMPVEGRYGLVGMQERAILCNGQFVIKSQPHAGTIIKLSIEG